MRAERIGEIDLRGDLGDEAAGRGAVVDEAEATRFEGRKDRREGGLVRDEARALIVHDADIAGEAAQQPLQARDIFRRCERGQQRVGTGIVLRIAIGLHRQFEEHFVARLTRLGDPTLQIVAIGREGKRDFRRKDFDCVFRRTFGNAEARNDERDAGPIGNIGGQRAGVDLVSLAAILGDDGERTRGGLFDEGGIGHCLQRCDGFERSDGFQIIRRVVRAAGDGVGADDLDVAHVVAVA